MLIDLTPLYKYRDYRLLYIGQFISWFGNMLTYVALPYQIFHLTHSSLAVGNIGLVQLIPLLITSLWGGALADILDRRKILLSAEYGLAFTTALLLFNALLMHPQIWLVYLAAGLGSALSGFHRPTIEAVTQSLVKREDMPSVAALASLKFSVVMILGPAIAGFSIAHIGLAFVYLLDFFTFAGSIVAVLLMKSQLSLERKGEPVLQSIKAGARYAMSRPELIGTYVVDFIAMVFGMPMALFPAIAETMGGAKALGWLYAAPSFGLLVTAIFSGWVNKVSRHGVAIALAASVWGLAIIAFGFSHHLYAAVLFLAIAGGADSISGLFRSTIWNQTIPEHLRGRLAGVEMIGYMSGPLLGNAEAGLVAAAFGTTFSVVSGGVLCVIGVGISMLLLPQFWKYKAAV